MTVKEPIEPPQLFWSTRKSTTMFLIALVGSGIVLLSVGILNEARVRPFWTCYNCEEGYDIDWFPVTYCECEPAEYIMHVVLIFCGLCAMSIGGGLLLTLLYHWKKTGKYWILEE